MRDRHPEDGPFWVYENWTNTFTKVHVGACAFCNDGRGIQGRGSSTPSGRWLGPFPSLDRAKAAARDAADRHPNAAMWNVDCCRFCG